MSNSIAPGSSVDVNVKVTALTTNPNVPVTYKTIILKKNLVNGVNTLTQEMINQNNVKYVIKYDFILDHNATGGTITVPQGCILEFDGGSLANAQGNSISITGNNTLLIGTNCINNIHFLGTFENDTISSDIFISDCYIKDLITLIKDGGIINIFSTINHDGLLFSVNKSFTINGNGNVLLIPVEQNICSNFLFDVNDSDSIVINDLVIDGQVSETAYADGNRIRPGYPIEHNYKWLMMITDCNNVIIKNCYFKNLWYENADNPEYPIEDVTNNISNENFAHYGFIGIIRCKNTILENNSFKNIYSEEGIVSVGEVDDNSSNTIVKNTDIIRIKNNNFICRGAFNTTSNLFEPIDSNLSTWINIMYKRCVVENNIFGCSGGSQINAFCYDSEISNNRFEASRSGAIDLDESANTKFIPKNVIIKNNISLGCVTFFQSASGENISIENNVLDNTGIPTGYGGENLAFIHHNRNESIVPISESLPLRNIYIMNNTSKGSLFFIRDDNWATIMGDKNHYVVENNHIESRTTHKNSGGVAIYSSRPVIQLSCFNDIIIRNNYMVNAGRPKCWGNNSISVTSRSEVFIEFGVCWHPNSYLHNIKIEGNTYVTDNYNLFISTAISNSGIIGDRLYYIPSIKHVNIENNRHIGTNRTDAWILSNETNFDNDNTFLNNSCNYLKSNILFKKDFPKSFTQLPHPRYNTQGVQVDKGIKYYTYSDNNLVEFLQRCYPSIAERYDKLGAYIQVNDVICLVVVTGDPNGNITTYTDNGNLKKDGTLVYYELETNPGLNKIVYDTLIK